MSRRRLPKKPRPLQPGDTVFVIAPCSPFSRKNLEAGMGWMEQQGFHVRYRSDIFCTWRYLAGDDRRRADELIEAFTTPGINAVICARGGYGANRLWPYLEDVELPAEPRLFMGFSDVTALHLMLYQKHGWVSLHGPMLGTRYAAEGFTPRSRTSFLRALTSSDPLPPMKGRRTITGGTVSGRLIGGNLSLLASSIGTPYQVDMTDAIVFLEDIGEAPYRLDRMLTQLLQSHVLTRAAGVVLGDFTDCDPPRRARFKTIDVLADLLGELEIPVAAGFPFGHTHVNLTMPVGIKAELDADTRTLRFLESATRRVTSP